VSNHTLPPFTAEGLLPIGDYPLTLAELRASHLVTGEGNPSSSWDQEWRALLVDNLTILAQQLWAVGITDIFVDGSFVEDKDRPGDIDGYFTCDIVALASGQLENDLNRLDPYRVWTWAWDRRRPGPDSVKAQLPMWHQYRVELYPHILGLSSGITDRYGNELEFPSAFRQSRGYLPKGIVVLRKGV
jgi:hypothetical protein